MHMCMYMCIKIQTYRHICAFNHSSVKGCMSPLHCGPHSQQPLFCIYLHMLDVNIFKHTLDVGIFMHVLCVDIFMHLLDVNISRYIHMCMQSCTCTYLHVYIRCEYIHAYIKCTYVFKCIRSYVRCHLYGIN